MEKKEALVSRERVFKAADDIHAAGGRVSVRTVAREIGGGSLRDICPLNDEVGPPLEQLDSSDCWTLGGWEARLAELQLRWSGRLERIELRRLFADPDAPPRQRGGGRRR